MKQISSDTMGWNAPGNGGGNGDSGNDNGGRDPWGRDNPPRGEKDLGTQTLELLKKLFGSGKSSGSSGRKGRNRPGSIIGAVIGLAIAGVIVSGFYTVREAERGVVLRFGKIYDVTDPGLRWKIPGIDTVNVVDIEQVRALQSSGTMLTQDENVVIVEMDVQYRISDPVKYLYSTTDPDHTLLEATDSALRYVVGHTLMDDILTSGREMVRQNTRELLSSIIEPYNTGLSIVDMNFLPARAPDQVKAAFDDAISAQEDEQRFKREAEAYANEVLPKADGQVQRIRQEAEAYRSQVVLNAQGEVARFEKVLPEYEKAPEITRQRIYFETMQQVMEKSRKVILDTPQGSSPVIYLPLPDNASVSSREQSKSEVDETVQALKEASKKTAEETVQNTSRQSQNTQRGYPPLNGNGYGNYYQRRN